MVLLRGLLFQSLKFRPPILFEYVTIYRSILKFWYIDRYMMSNIDRYMNFSKNHYLTDICRNFSFFDRYMKIFIFHKIAICDFDSMFRFIKSSYIGQYNISYIDLYKNVYKTQRRISIYICNIQIILACCLYRSEICWVLIMTNI